MQHHYVWIVEGLYYDPSQVGSQTTWHPTIGCALTKEDGKQILNDWKRRNPDDKFRIRRYINISKV